MRWKHAAPAALVLLLAGGACSANDDDASSSSGTSADGSTATTADDAASTTAPVATGPAPGVTDDAIRIGVTYVDVEAIRQFVDIDQGDFEATYSALVDPINAAGGIHGRQIELVFAPVSPLGTVPAEEACVRLTEDEDVFAVLGFFQDDAVNCYLETHETAIIGGVVTAARHERANAPWFTTDPGSEDSEVDAVRALAEAGELDGTLGVFGSINTETQMNDVVLPLLEELGVEPAETAILDAPADDLAAQNQGVAVIAERFRSSNVDTVLVVGSAAVPLLNGLAPLDYRPELVFTSVVSASSYKDGLNPDLSLYEGSVVGSVDNEVYDEAAMQDCMAQIVDAGVEPAIPSPVDVPAGDPNPFVAASAACRNVNLFAAIAEAAGPDLNYGTFQAAGESLGSVHLPGAEDDYTYGPYPAIDGDLPMYVMAWNPDERRFARPDA